MQQTEVSNSELHKDIKRLIALLELHRTDTVVEPELTVHRNPVVVRISPREFSQKDIAQLTLEEIDEELPDRRHRHRDGRECDKNHDDSYIAIFIFTALLVGLAYSAYSLYCWERSKYTRMLSREF